MKVENPTSRDIADIAGVSQATVSRALRNSPLVRPETRERIQEIARELNYFVNRNAAGLLEQCFRNRIALINVGSDRVVDRKYFEQAGSMALALKAALIATLSFAQTA